MKKLIIFFLSIVLTAVAANGQTGKADQPFFFIGAKTLYKLVLSPDTLAIYRCSSYYIHSDSKLETLYKILGVEKRGDYRVYYVESLVQLSAPQQPPRKFKSISLKYPENGQTAQLLVEGNSYPTLEECKRQTPADPDSKFLITYYSEQKLQSFMTYRNMKDLDSLATDKLLLTFKQDLESSKQKLMNTDIVDLYGSVVGRELLNRAMIELKVNPLIRIEEIEKKIKSSPFAKEMGGS